MNRISLLALSLFVATVSLFSCQRQEEGLGPGRFAPDVPLLSLTGEQTTLRDVTRGQVVLLNFWASWCQPCKVEMPDLEELHTIFEPPAGEERKFSVIGIAVDDRKDAIEQFVRDTGVTFPVYYDRGGLSNTRFGLGGYPESFFLDPDGRFLMVLDPGNGEPVIKVVGPRAWNGQASIRLIQGILDRIS